MKATASREQRCHGQPDVPRCRSGLGRHRLGTLRRHRAMAVVVATDQGCTRRRRILAPRPEWHDRVGRTHPHPLRRRVGRSDTTHLELAHSVRPRTGAAAPRSTNTWTRLRDEPYDTWPDARAGRLRPARQTRHAPPRTQMRRCPATSRMHGGAC
ncbi:hypothetical protein STPH1_1650 [Streptomyces sp. OM5714]|nr:hypothetical protein STPH1_1650 [Streptomyces sp. OM5714]